MTELRVKSINLTDKDIKAVEAVNNEAFPEPECMSIGEMFTFPIKSELLGFYDAETLVGFSLLLHNAETVFAVLLAIGRSYRKNGYGSKALQSVIKNYPNKQIVLDFEQVVKTAENYEQRVSRKRFYLRNGFYETGRFTVLFGDKYEVVCSREKLNEESLNEVLAAIHKHTPEFEETLK